MKANPLYCRREADSLVKRYSWTAGLFHIVATTILTMSESSEASFPGFDSGDICNLPATEGDTGTGSPQLTSLPTNTDPDEAMAGQVSAVVPPRGDSPADQIDFS